MGLYCSLFMFLFAFDAWLSALPGQLFPLIRTGGAYGAPVHSFQGIFAYGYLLEDEVELLSLGKDPNPSKIKTDKYGYFNVILHNYVIWFLCKIIGAASTSFSTFHIQLLNCLTN